MANCGPARSPTICSGAVLTPVTFRMTGSCARASSPHLLPPEAAVVAAVVRRFSRRSCRRGPPILPPTSAAESPAAWRRLSDHRARTRNLWGGAAAGPAVGAFDPRHPRRPGRRHLRARRLRRSAHARRRADFCGRPADQEAGGRADQEARACALPALLALGLGPLLRPNDQQPLSGLRRSARQRQYGRLPGRDRSSARISDRRSATSAPASMALTAT